MRLRNNIFKIGAGALLFLFLLPAAALAAMSSSSYQVIFDSLNDGGVSSSSSNFATGNALGNGFGNSTTGGSSSSSYSFHGGFAAGLLGNTPVAPPPPPPGGGGGGGGGGLPAPTVIYSGLTAPGALVQVYINGSLVGAAYANGAGVFTISSAHTGTFSATISSTDAAGRSVTLVHDVNLPNGGNVSGILFPPADALSADVTKIGDQLIVTGSATPGSVIAVTFKPPLGAPPVMHAVVPGSDGTWQTTFATVGYGEGIFSVEATATYLGVSATSTVNGTLSKTVSTPPAGVCAGVADLNCDGKVNLQDVSIMLAFFHKADFPARYDLNSDGKIDLIDFSILLYHWKK